MSEHRKGDSCHVTSETECRCHWYELARVLCSFKSCQDVTRGWKYISQRKALEGVGGSCSRSECPRLRENVVIEDKCRTLVTM